MTSKEKEMFEIIRENPRITQAELAEKLKITRSSTSVHISNLIKKGYIAGRGYVLNEPKYVTVIGAANIDIIARSADELILEDSNPGTMSLCAGGVGRNIADNLSRLSVNAKLISSLADDAFGKQIVEYSESVGIDMKHCYIKPQGTSSIYVAILQNDGEMKVALSDMRVLDEMPVKHLYKRMQLIRKSELIVIDAGLPETTVEYILANFKENRIFLDPVSVGKAKHVKKFIGSFDTIKVNKLEAEFLSDIRIIDQQSLEQVGEFFIHKGVRRVFLSLGKDGVYYKTREEQGRCPSPFIRAVNATGAGDAFMAGIVYCSLKEKSNRYTAEFSAAMARIALKSETTVSTFMSLDKVKREMENLEDKL